MSEALRCQVKAETDGREAEKQVVRERRSTRLPRRSYVQLSPQRVRRDGKPSGIVAVHAQRRAVPTQAAARGRYRCNVIRCAKGEANTGEEWWHGYREPKPRQREALERI